MWMQWLQWLPLAALILLVIVRVVVNLFDHPGGDRLLDSLR